MSETSSEPKCEEIRRFKSPFIVLRRLSQCSELAAGTLAARPNPIQLSLLQAKPCTPPLRVGNKSPSGEPNRGCPHRIRLS